MDRTQISHNGMHPGSVPNDTEPNRHDMEQMLAAIGLGYREARLYAAVLAHPGATADELIMHVDMPARRARAILSLLSSHGLVSRTANRPARYLPTPPDVAIEPLIARRQTDLQQARALAHELAERVRRSAPSGDGQEAIELLTGREAVAQRFQQLEQGTLTDLVGFDLPPYYGGTAENQGETAALARGVSVRTVYAPEALEHRGTMDHVRAMAAQGEQAGSSPRHR